MAACRRGAAGLIVWILGLLTLGCASDDPSHEPQVEHLVLISVDTWRGDHFLAERGGVDLTPNLEALAAESVVFTHVQSVSNVTSPGVAGILTGLLPQRSGVRVNVHVLPETVPTLGTILADAGFTTAAFVGNPVLAPGNGFEKGFEVYELVPRERPRRKVLAAAVTDRAISWLEQRSREAPGERLFLWVHYMDPHGPYEPPDEVVAEFDEASFDAPPDIPLQPNGNQSGYGAIPAYQQYGQREPSRDGRYYALRYAAAVRYLDAEIGRLLSHLRQQGLLDRAVLALSADHGEALAGDQGFFFSHGNGVSEDQIRVPLLLRIPDGPRGEVAGRTVSTADVAPTVLEFLAVRSPIRLDGFPLLGESERTVVSQTHVGAAAVEWPWKLCSYRSGRLSLFNLETDPGEAVNVADRHPEVVRRLQEQLRAVRREPALAPSRERDVDSEEKRRALQDLGYL